MRTVNIHEAKTHLSRLIERAAAGDPFIIAKAGRPLVKVVAIDAPGPGAERRLGFLQAPRVGLAAAADAIRGVQGHPNLCREEGQFN